MFSEFDLEKFQKTYKNKGWKRNMDWEEKISTSRL
jgi:hypothetical protein